MTAVLDTIRTVRRLRNSLLSKGGFTYDLQADKDLTSGYALSVNPKDTRVLDIRNVTVADLWMYVTDRAVSLSLPNKVFGGWVDTETGKVHLDVVTVFADREYALDRARVYSELAIYHLDTNTEIRV